MRSRSQGLGPQRPSPLSRANSCRNLDFINKNETDLDGLEEGVPLSMRSLANCTY
jgi:hypothetical protein